jgi:hypothetical protein
VFCRPKEERLLDVLDFERQRGRQCWVYVQYTGEKDCLARLENHCCQRGFNTGTLQARATSLMGQKMEAAQAMEGKFSA